MTRASSDRALEAKLRKGKSAERRSVAKQLRKTPRVALQPALADALTLELANPRAWENQYHLICALGQCGRAESLDLLWSICDRADVAPMVHFAVADALLCCEFARIGHGGRAVATIFARQRKLKSGAFDDTVMAHAPWSRRELFLDGLMNRAACLCATSIDDAVAPLIRWWESKPRDPDRARSPIAMCRLEVSKVPRAFMRRMKEHADPDIAEDAAYLAGRERYTSSAL